jgi:CHAT domain-containing protein
MSRKQYFFGSHCFSGLSLRRLGYLFLAVAIALTQIFFSSTSIQASAPATLVEQGKIAYDRGDFPLALITWQQAEAAYHQTKDTLGITGSQLNQSQALVAMGMHRRACKALTKVVQVTENICDDALPEKFGIRSAILPLSLQALALSSFGDVLRLLGNLEAAQITLAQAREISQSLPTDAQTPILVSIANTLQDLGNRERDRTDRLQPPSSTSMSCPTQPVSDRQAAEYYQYAIACYQQANNLTAQINNLGLLVEISRWLEQNQAGNHIQNWQQQFDQSTLIEKIKPQLLNQPHTYDGFIQRINFARSFATTNPLQRKFAQELLNSVIAQAKLLGQSAILANAIGTLGWIYEQNQQWPEALKFTQEATDLAAITAGNDSWYQLEWQLGRILQHQSRPDLEKSKTAYEKAVAALEKIRGNIRVINPDAQFSLRDAVEPLYRELIDLDFRSDQPDLAQIITQLDKLKLVELENFLDCEINVDRSVDKFAEDSGAVVFYPVVLADRLEVIVRLAHNEFQRFSVAASRSELERTIASFKFELTQPQNGWDDAPASQLYDWLIRPAQKYLTPQTKNLVFVMDGALQNMPVAALYDRSNRTYLIDQYPVAVTPGLKILGAIRSSGNQAQILIGGLTTTLPITLNSKRGGVYEPLAFAATEVQTIKSLFPRSTELVGRNFTEDNIRRVLGDDAYSMIHLATHGQFSSDPRQTFILTDAGRSIDLNSLRSILQQGRSRAFELMVLSACETAAGDRRAALGLAGVAVRSGAASTLASLWSVDDGATAELMQGFYRSLRDGKSKAESLRIAQQQVRRDQPHPYYWSAFMLVGNWL